MTIATTQKQKEEKKKALEMKAAGISAQAKKKTPVKKAISKTIKKAASKATPKTTVKPKKAKTNMSVEDLLQEIIRILEDGKAQNILPISLKGKTSLADYLVIASGTSTRQVMALASTLSEKLKDKGYKPRMEGKDGSGEWMILDLGDIIVHIFHPETRSFYEIEELWGEKTPSP